VKEQMFHKMSWTIRRYATDKDYLKDNFYSESYFEGNVLLNEGIQELEQLLIGGTATAYNHANSYIGVGDSDTAAVATQTGLQASSNKKYVANDTSYPSRSSQTLTWKATFGSSDGNFAWNEFTVANGSSDSAKNLNRKVSSQGTKVSGQTWVITATLVIS